ncbi:hypothetical protein DEO72_LG2g3856 [Vigna unguiculata]|uniref:Uncharacterized protein n=1 Tax=Vigna unguiculata TaxID=3917 RepID=A0A4D6L4S1_VIGUN|nr:hypothetical protein DEO72_LG2g3856 [Vigna unguiculata]
MTILHTVVAANLTGYRTCNLHYRTRHSNVQHRNSALHLFVHADEREPTFQQPPAETSAHKPAVQQRASAPAIIASAPATIRGEEKPPPSRRSHQQPRISILHHQRAGFNLHLLHLAVHREHTAARNRPAPFPQPPPQIERDERFHLASPRTCTAKHFAGAPTSPATPSVHAPILAGKEDLAEKRQQSPSLHLRSQSVRETLILERESALPRVSI